MSDRLVQALDLTSATRSLTECSSAFTSVQVGTREISVAKVLDAVRAEPGLVPPRSGHLGNWEDIALGRSGPMDFNTAVCGGGYGYPLIYGFTRTEADTAGGDDVYLPGSLVEGGRRRPLQLSTWGGQGFVRRDRSVPLFCPLVKAETDEGLVPLIDVHWQRMGALTGYEFDLEANRLLAHAPLVVDMLCVLLAEADQQANPRRAYAELISHAVRLDGQVDRCEILPDGGGYVIDGHRFASARDLSEAALLPLQALVEPSAFFGQIADLPPVLPVMSHLLAAVLTAMFGTDYPRMQQSGAAGQSLGVTNEGVRVHLHWGARAMAGCPPRRSGYFGRKSTTRSLRRLMSPLARNFAEARPLMFVLLPAPIFMLCPRDSEPADASELARLFRAILAAPSAQAYTVAGMWLSEHLSTLSPYMRARFQEGSGVPRDGLCRKPGVPVEPEGFRELSMQQACAAVAAFEEVMA